jgi:hypothetical protein
MHRFSASRRIRRTIGRGGLFGTGQQVSTCTPGSAKKVQEYGQLQQPQRTAYEALFRTMAPKRILDPTFIRRLVEPVRHVYGVEHNFGMAIGLLQAEGSMVTLVGSQLEHRNGNEGWRRKSTYLIVEEELAPTNVWAVV